MNNESQWIYTKAIAFIIFTPVHNLHARTHARSHTRPHARTHFAITSYMLRECGM